MKDFFKYFLMSAILFLNSNAVLAESYIVKLKSPEAGAASLNPGRSALDALPQLGGHIKSAITTSNGNLFAVVDIDEAKALELQSADAVEALEKDRAVRAFRVPNDYCYAKQWGLNRVGAEAAWDRSTGKSGDVIAVLDTGIDLDHPDLYRNIWVNPEETNNDGIDDDKNGFIDDSNGWNFISNNNDVNDDMDHGTHVAGIIAAIGDNGRGVAGVSYDSRLLSIKVLDSKGEGFVSSIINGIIYATNLKARGRANVIAINLSLGLNGESNALKEAIRYAEYYGISVAVAAGNEASNNDLTPVSPANLAAELDNVISVAALTQTGALASFSNYGEKYVTVAAPGEKIYSTIPYDEKTDDPYAFFDGTSMAAPFVTGAIGLIKGINPSLNPKSIKNIIANGAYNSLLSGLIQGANELNIDRAVSYAAMAYNIFKVRGSVLANGYPLEGIQMFCNGCTNDYASTDAWGSFEFDVRENTSVNIRPYADGFRFNPEYRTGAVSSDSTADFEAIKTEHVVTIELKGFKGDRKGFIIALRGTDGVHDWIGKTSSKGRVIFKDVDEGKYKVALYDRNKKQIKLKGNRVTINSDVKFRITLRKNK